MASGSGSDSDSEDVSVSGSGSESGPEFGSKQRGPTVKAKANTKTIITYNKRGVPVGPGAKKLSTFEGLVARSMVLITYDSWLVVDAETKEACWQYILTHFVVSPKSRKQVLQSIGVKWKNFKHYLYKKYIKPLKDDESPEAKEQLNTPPACYPSVKKKVWKLFVSQRTKKAFEERSAKASAIRARNKYNHRLSRKGYAGLISEMMTETGLEEEEIDRVECWKKAREKKKGGFDPAVQQVIDKIEELKKDKDFIEDPMGAQDLLAEALGTEEQRGRVRGMGRYITPHQYFLIPKNVKQYLRQHDAKTNQRLREVEDELARMKRCASNASEGASNYHFCSDQDEEPNEPSEPNDKSCYLAVDDPSNIVAKGTIVNPTVEDGNLEVTVDTSVQGEAKLPNPIPDELVETVNDALGYILSWPTHLVIPCSALNKIAVSKKMEKKAAAQEKEKRRIDEANKRKKDEEEAKRKEEEGKKNGELGTVTQQKKENKKKRQREANNEEPTVGKKRPEVDQLQTTDVDDGKKLHLVAVEVKDKGKSPETLGSVAKTKKKAGNPLRKMTTRGQKRVRKRINERLGLKMTAMMVDGQVAKVDSIKAQCEDDLFGYDSFTYLNWNDFDKLFAMDELSGAVVASYTMFLYEQIKNGSQQDHGVCFMTPTATMSSERKARAQNIEDASRVIAKRLSSRKQNDIVIVPFNPGRHWVLGVLNMKTSTCYYLDSLTTSDVNSQFKQIVDAAIAMYDVQVGSSKRTKLIWVNSKCPRQPGFTECGYFMLKFMKEVVKHGVRVLENDNIGGESNNYTDADFDEIREEWCAYVSNFIFRE